MGNQADVIVGSTNLLKRPHLPTCILGAAQVRAGEPGGTGSGTDPMRHTPRECSPRGRRQTRPGPPVPQPNHIISPRSPAVREPELGDRSVLHSGGRMLSFTEGSRPPGPRPCHADEEPGPEELEAAPGPHQEVTVPLGSVLPQSLSSCFRKNI